MTLIDELRESGNFEGVKYAVWDSEDLPEAHDPKCEDTVAAVVLQMDDHEFESESYEEVEEEEDVSHDESPQVITIVTTLPSAGSHRPRSRLSLPNSGYEIDNVQSTMSANMLKILKKTFSIPNTVFLHLLQDDDLPSFPLEDKVTFCSDFFRFDVRLPLHPFINRVLYHYKLAPSQLCPNGWRILVGTLALFRSMYNDDPSLAEF
ncbi:hypothetical protein LWI29_003705 [Acer saccharum]|uniref:Transposase (putative) gypsy type domain-containing protein n=1 Tax=Acer saccharum TaxID=4024 RepID=A0AA39RQ28_ACESA|nr:hypothetical protein LWI29_003705 [Acer saccharum]